MAHLQVTYITTIGTTHEHITHIAGSGWRYSVADAIRRINARTDSFYTSVGGRTADVGVVDGRYLRTYANGQWNDNLLSLPKLAA